MPADDRPGEDRIRQFIREHTVLSNFGLVMLMVLALSFSCSGIFTSLIDDEQVRQEQFLRHVGYGMLGPPSYIVEHGSVPGMLLLYLGIFALLLLGLSRMRFGCLSALLAAVIAFCWFAVGFMVGGAPYW